MHFNAVADLAAGLGVSAKCGEADLKAASLKSEASGM